jgi:hypothetical protein
MARSLATKISILSPANRFRSEPVVHDGSGQRPASVVGGLVVTQFWAGKGAAPVAYSADVEIRRHLSRMRRRLSPDCIGLPQGEQGRVPLFDLQPSPGGFRRVIRSGSPAHNPA